MGLKKEIIKVNVINLNPVRYGISNKANKRRRINTTAIKKIAARVIKRLSRKHPPSPKKKIRSRYASVDARRRPSTMNSPIHESGQRKLNLNIILVRDKYIKNLNRTYRHRNLATDVLCFCMPGGADIFISSEAAAYNSKRFGTTFFNELCLYIIHGILHMFGFRDDTASKRRKMERAQERILKELT